MKLNEAQKNYLHTFMKGLEVKGRPVLNQFKRAGNCLRYTDSHVIIELFNTGIEEDITLYNQDLSDCAYPDTSRLWATFGHDIKREYTVKELLNTVRTIKKETGYTKQSKGIYLGLSLDLETIGVFKREMVKVQYGYTFKDLDELKDCSTLAFDINLVHKTLLLLNKLKVDTIKLSRNENPARPLQFEAEDIRGLIAPVRYWK